MTVETRMTAVRRAIRKVDSGWELLAIDGKPTRTVKELCFLIDLKHSLALFPGTRDDVEAHRESILRKCRQVSLPEGEEPEDYSKVLCVACLPGDLDESEANHMLLHLGVPRRVSMRLRRAMV